MNRLERYGRYKERAASSGYLHVFLTILVIVISGNPAVGILPKEVIYIGSFLIFVAAWLFRPVKFTGLDRLVISSFALLSFEHIVAFGSIAVAAEFGSLVKLSIGLLAVRAIPKFSGHYVQAMYWISIVSFVFFIPLYLGVDMRNVLASLRIPLPDGNFHYHVGFYNLREEYDVARIGVRNMGMFWEPGAFAGYLVLALFFVMRDGQLAFWRSRAGIVLVLALLSTRSTAGYLAFFILIIFYSFGAGWIKNTFAKVVAWSLLVAALTPVATVLFGQSAFLGEKIHAQIEAARLLEDSSRINRFGNILYDMKWIADRPLLGWSANPETRLAFDPDALELAAGQGNGLTGFTVKNGVVGTLMFFFFFSYATLKNCGSKLTAIFGSLVVMLLLNGEQYLNFPIFLSLMFVQYGKPTRSRRILPKVNPPVMRARKPSTLAQDSATTGRRIANFFQNPRDSYTSNKLEFWRESRRWGCFGKST